MAICVHVTTQDTHPPVCVHMTIRDGVTSSPVFSFQVCAGNRRICSVTTAAAVSLTSFNLEGLPKKHLLQVEDWIYGDGAEVQKSVYVQKLEELK